jgi:hypothetical protein
VDSAAAWSCENESLGTLGRGGGLGTAAPPTFSICSELAPTFQLDAGSGPVGRLHGKLVSSRPER